MFRSILLHCRTETIYNNSSIRSFFPFLFLASSSWSPLLFAAPSLVVPFNAVASLEPAETDVRAEPVHFPDYLNTKLIEFVMQEVTNTKPELWTIFTNAEEKIFEGLEDQPPSAKYSTLLRQLDGRDEPSLKFARRCMDDPGMNPFCILVLRQLAAHSTDQSPILFCVMAFVCAFATLERRLTPKEFVSTKISVCTPCVRVQLILNSVKLPVLEPNQKPMLASLITSTMNKFAAIEHERNKLKPPILRAIQDRHTELSAGASNPAVAQQFDFVAASHASFCCPNENLVLSCERFIRSYSGAPITNCFVSPSDSVTGAYRQLQSDVVNIVAGSSGSGKTISALTAGSTKQFPVCNIMLHAESAGFVGDNDTAALRGLLQGIFAALGVSLPIIMNAEESPQSPVAGLLDPTCSEMIKTLKELFQAPLEIKLHNWPFTLRIIVDEIGLNLTLLRSFGRIWKQVRSLLAECLGVPEQNLQLVAVGAGADNFEINGICSPAESYQVLTVARGDFMFKTLFEQQLDSATSSASSQIFVMLFGELPRSHVRTNRSVSNTHLSNHPMLHALRRLATNVRCGVIILHLIHDTFEKNGLHNPGSTQARQHAALTLASSSHNEQCTPEQLHALVAHWCMVVVSMFCSRSGLAKLPSAASRFYVLGKAMSFSLNRTTTLAEDSWILFAAQYGLLTDSAVQETTALHNKTKFEEIPVFTCTNKATKERSKYFLLLDSPRFHFEEAFVMIHSLLSQSLSNGVFAKNFTNVGLPFEEAVFDYIRIATQFGVKTASASVVPSSTGFTHPRHLFGIGSTAVHSVRLSFPLCERLFDDFGVDHVEERSPERSSPHHNSPSHKQQHHQFSRNNSNPLENMETLQRSFALWHQLVSLEGSSVVLLNDDCASGGGDLIVLAPNRIVFVQFKNSATGAIDSEMIEDEIMKMRGRRLLEVLCWCVCDSKKDIGEIDVFYVIAGRNKESFYTGNSRSPKYFVAGADRNEIFETALRREVAQTLEKVKMKTHDGTRKKLIDELQALPKNKSSDRGTKSNINTLEAVLDKVCHGDGVVSKKMTMEELIDDIKTSTTKMALLKNRLRSYTWEMSGWKKTTTRAAALVATSATTTTTMCATELDASHSWHRIWEGNSSPHKRDKYLLHESIHFTFATAAEPCGMSPFYPVLQSKLPVANSVFDQYITTRIVAPLADEKIPGAIDTAKVPNLSEVRVDHKLARNGKA